MRAGSASTATLPGGRYKRRLQASCYATGQEVVGVAPTDAMRSSILCAIAADHWRVPADLLERGQAYDLVRDRANIRVSVLSPTGLD
jgi:hypothetical protein